MATPQIELRPFLHENSARPPTAQPPPSRPALWRARSTAFKTDFCGTKSSSSSHLIRAVHRHFLQVTRFFPVKNLTTRSKKLDRVRAMLSEPQRQQVTMAP